MSAIANPEQLSTSVAPGSLMPEELLRGEDFVSAAAESAVCSYSRSIVDGRLSQRAYEHPINVANLLHDLMGLELERSVYDAAALHDLAQVATSEGAGKASAVQALREYSQKVAGEYVESDSGFRCPKWDYMSTLLSDMDEIEECSQLGRQIETEHVIVSDLLQSKIEGPVPQEAWSEPSGLVDLTKIENLLQNVNLESALVKAAEMLDNLRNPAPSERSVLQDVFDAESFYAPLCEAMGFDGLSMALRSEAAIIRLRRGGHEDVLEEAETMLAGLSDREQVLSDVSGLFQHLLDGVTTVETPLRDASGHGIKLGNVALHALGIGESNTDPRAHWRVKTLGSLAVKLAKTGEKPADVLGVTIVVGDLEELAVTYKGLVECIRANKVVKERPASSRSQAYSIQGAPEYITTVAQELYETGVVNKGDVEEVPKDNGHQVAKATFVYRPHVVDRRRPKVEIPIELQIQTAEDWLASRIGSAAHLLYKAGAIGDHTVIAAIQKRREHLKAPSLNPRSLDRGAQFRSNLDLAA